MEKQNLSKEELFKYNESILLANVDIKSVLWKFGKSQLEQIKEEYTKQCKEEYDLDNDEILKGDLFKYISDEDLCYFILNYSLPLFGQENEKYMDNLIEFRLWANNKYRKNKFFGEPRFIVA